MDTASPPLISEAPRGWTNCLWAKTDASGPEHYHPLILHLLDVACCADAVLLREPTSTRERMGAILGMDWEEARPWILLIIACHDLGKACPSFQNKCPAGRARLESAGFRFPPGLELSIVSAEGTPPFPRWAIGTTLPAFRLGA